MVWSRNRMYVSRTINKTKSKALNGFEEILLNMGCYQHFKSMI